MSLEDGIPHPDGLVAEIRRLPKNVLVDSIFMDYLNWNSTGVECSCVWILSDEDGCLGGMSPEIRLGPSSDRTLSMSIAEESLLASGHPELRIPCEVLEQVRRWIRLNRRLLLEWWLREVDTLKFVNSVRRI
ncbi:MAG: hypothetical protein LBT40_11080 [Deltaproteobacteria bacterium]|nr:hypothetical protein [Deltaproteobacteria bacterium]